MSLAGLYFKEEGHSFLASAGWHAIIADLYSDTHFVGNRHRYHPHWPFDNRFASLFKKPM